ncbi:MAG: hypothetical protein J7L38_08665 [Thermoproteales archaeon]|nr:hypothetical protein [Thermoproteales archaeon]
MGLIEAIRRALFNLTDKYIGVDDGSLDELSGQLGIFASARLLGFDGSKWQRLRCDEDKHLLTAVEKVYPASAIEGSTTSTSFVTILSIDVVKYRYLSLRLTNKATSSDDMSYQIVLKYPDGYNVYTLDSGTLSAGANKQLHRIGILGIKLNVLIKSATGGKVDYYLNYILEK